MEGVCVWGGGGGVVRAVKLQTIRDISLISVLNSTLYFRSLSQPLKICVISLHLGAFG